MDRDEIREILLKTGAVSLGDLIGCSESEVDAYFNGVGVKLPTSYREFLLAIGHGSGKFLLGTDILFKHLPVIGREARSLLLECGGKEDKIPTDAIVFYMHQGYEFGYFCASESEDPAVYQYIEGDDCPKLVWCSFTEYLIDMIRVFRESL
jgi:SMI1-KNR4 cell-wall